MSFRITPNDVGRRVQLRNGRVVQILEVLDPDEYNYPVKLSGDIRVGLMGNYDSYEKNELDAIFFVNSTTADQVRPKDLRDEFAMMAMGALMSEPIRWVNSAKSHKMDENEYLGKYSYAMADAMMKARGSE